MTDTRPTLFDRKALRLHRNRATERGLFLHDLAIDMVNERLEEITRDFDAAAVISWQANRWAQGLGLQAELITADDVLDLPREPHFDLIIHGLELHWMDDPVGQLIQMRKALKPDGLMIAVLFGEETLASLKSELVAAEIEARGGLSPRFAPMGEIRDLGGLLQRAGFALPVADNHIQKVNYSSVKALMQDLREMGETNAMQDRSKSFTAPSIFKALSKNTHETDISETFELVFLTGWAPSETQQKPMRPGSASHALADALAQLSQEKPS